MFTIGKRYTEPTYNYSNHNKMLKWYHPYYKGKIDTNINIIEVPGTEIKSVHIDMCTQPKAAPEKMIKTYAETPNIFGNCGFFATNTGDSCFNVISKGKTYSENAQYTDGWGLTKNGELSFGDLHEKEWEDFVTAYPPLVKNGEILSINTAQEINYGAHRHLFGWTLNKETIFDITIEGQGFDFYQCQSLIQVLYPNVYYCANLDGGGSVAQYFDGKRISDAGWERPVDTVLAIYVRSDEERENDTSEDKEEIIRYVVQLGAFSKKENADNLLNKIKLLKTDIHDYQDAYITKEGDYFKVQCGSFSNKTNAERMSEDLKNHGYDNYIKTKLKFL